MEILIILGFVVFAVFSIFGVISMLKQINRLPVMGTIGSKPKTQTDYAREHSKEFEVEVKNVIISTLKEKQKKRKPKTVADWEDNFDLGGHE
jgi:hypothetical protein